MSDDSIQKNREAIFNTAAEIDDPAERDAFLDRECGGDAELKAEIQDLLGHDAAAGSFLESPPRELLAADKPPQPAPTLDSHADQPSPPTATSETGGSFRYFGDYELLDEIARGGMGVVYRARQVNLNRTVAVKMILSGQLAGEGDVARFYTEAEAAANLQHPGIVAIHEVGEHGGQHYFSMDFIEGQSLADLVSQHPLPARDAARIIQQVAEAIQFAHDRGVVHRDLKPANILLAGSEPQSDAAPPFDPESLGLDVMPKVTDFGLAKRIEGDSDLTATGQILGTPSYMPPEQADSSRGPIGPTSDIYSLGAILYELLVGRPPFRAESTFDTILQVLQTEPAAPRLLNSNVPRDLETICLKCLAKDPYERYPTAAELADDLGRFLAGDAIEARPVSPVEKAGRWLWKRRVAVGLVAGTALAVFAAVIGVLRGMESYRVSLLTRIGFQTVGPALTAEVLYPDRDELVVPRFTVPTQEPQELPPGEFRLRLSSPRQVSEEYQFVVERGNHRNWDVVLDDRSLWPPIEINANEQYRRMNLESTPDFMIYHRDGLRRVRGTTGEIAWTSPETLPEEISGFRWEHLMPDNATDLPAWFLDPPVDFDGDGVRDIVIGNGQRPALLALSGETGEFLWTWSAEPAPRHITGTSSAMQSFDVNEDGTPDVLAVITARGKAPIDEGGRYLGQTAIAVSGADGELLWRRKFQGPSFNASKADARIRQPRQPGDPHVFEYVLDRIWRWDVRTGEPVGEPVAFRDIETLADLDGDGEPDTGLKRTRDSVSAVSMETGAETYSHRFEQTHEPVRYRRDDRLPGWVDFNDDGTPELLAIVGPNERGMKLRSVDARTGEVLWERLLPIEYFDKNEQDTNMRMIPGPDINGDGWRELFLATIGMPSNHNPVSHRLFVDAISGKDGVLLWSWNAKTRGHISDASVGPLAWAWRGNDGWPTLAVPHRFAWSSVYSSKTFLIEIGKGRLYQKLNEIREVEADDFDGDGLTDLFWFESLDHNNPNWQGELHGLRGMLPAWRRLERWDAGGDVDGDGVADLVNHGGGLSRTASVASGATGRLVWTTGAQFEKSLSESAPLGDFDGDGVPDVVTVRQSHTSHPPPITAFSGKDGARLWNADKPLAERDTSHVTPGGLLELHDLDGDGTGELIALMVMQSKNGSQPQLIAYDSHTGEARWQFDVDVSPWRQLHMTYVDLTGDAVKDLLLPIAENGSTLIAVDGQNGTELWNWNDPNHHWDSNMIGKPAPVVPVAKMTADESPGVIVNARNIVALDAGGKELWKRQFQPRPTVRIHTTVVRRSAPRQFGVYVYYNKTANVDGQGRVPIHTYVVERNERGDIVQEALLPPNSQLVCVDLDGDGEEETVVLTETELLAFDQSLSDPPLWKWNRLEGRADLLDILRQDKDAPPTIVVTVDYIAYGIVNGAAQWRVDVTEPLPERVRRQFRLQAKVLPARDQLPSFYVLYSQSPRWSREGIVCRQAVATTANGNYLPPIGIARPYDQRVHDVRQFRPLPWNDDIEEWPWILFTTVLLAAAANVLVFRWGRRPPLSGVMLLLTTVVTLALVGIITPLAAPLSIFLFLLIRYIVQRRLVATAVLLIGAMAIGAVVLAAVLYEMSGQMLPGQQIDWQGWHAVLFIGAYGAGLAALPVLGVTALVRRNIERQRRIRSIRKRMHQAW